MACTYEVWQSVKNNHRYWHLLDNGNNIVAEGGGGYGLPSSDACIEEMNKMELCVGATIRNLPVRQIRDPNA